MVSCTEYVPKSTADKDEIKNKIIELLNTANHATTDQAYKAAEQQLINLLNDEIQPVRLINQYYFKKAGFQKNKHELSTQYNDYFYPQHMPYWVKTEPALDGETWNPIQVKTHVGTLELEVSNFGRIRRDGKILPQSEDPDKQTVGWLTCLDIKYVYNLVAGAFGCCTTALYRGQEQTYYVHHISNDGYDNRPCNLVCLPARIHNQINHHP